MKTHINFTLGLMVVISLGLFLLRGPMSVETDSTNYLIGAKFIYQGLGYMDYGYDSQEIKPQIDWPPLLSFLIAAVMKITGSNEIFSSKVINFLSLLLYYLSNFWLSTLIFKDHFFRVIANVLIVTSSLIWTWLPQVQSEPLFIGLFSFSIVAALKATISTNRMERNTFFFLTGVVLMLLSLARYVGLFMVISYCVFFLTLKHRYYLKQMFLEMTLFLMPIIVGVGGWLLRNKLLTGHFTFLEFISSRSLFSDFIKKQSIFLRSVFEAIIGSTRPAYEYTNHLIEFIPVYFFLFCLVLVAILAWRKRNTLFNSKTDFYFPRLCLITVFIYIFLLNGIWLKNGFGDSERYFRILCPSIFLFVLLLIQRLIAIKSQGFKPLKYASVAGLSFFLSASVFFHALIILRVSYHSLSTVSYPRTGVNFLRFRNAQWVFELVEKGIKKSDILISNFPDFLSYYASKPCRTNFDIFNQIAVPAYSNGKILEIALGDAQNEFREVYVVLQKDSLWNTKSGPIWDSYLKKVRHEVIREDDYAVAIKLIK